MGEIANSLRQLAGVHVSARGSHQSAFLYVRSCNKAVEVSLDGHEISVEYWDAADEESDDEPVKEEVFVEKETALASIQAWL